MNVPGIVSSKSDKDTSEILFHHNDHEMHQGEQSIRKPDVVVLSRKAAYAVQEDVDLNERLDVFVSTRTKPKKHFQWRNILSIVEFKRSGGRNKMNL